MARPYEWVKLDAFQCPVTGCPSREPVRWECSRCRSAMLLNGLGQMVCEGGNHFGNICEWNWNCGSSHHKGWYQRADMESFTFAFSQAVQLMGKMGSVWVAHLMKEIEKQYTRQNDGYYYNRRDDGYYYDRRDDGYYSNRRDDGYNYNRRDDGYYYDRRYGGDYYDYR